MLLCVHLELLLKFSPPASSHTFWVNAHQIHSTYIVNYFVDVLIIVRNLVCSNMVLHSVVRGLLFPFLKIILSFLFSFLLPSPSLTSFPLSFSTFHSFFISIIQVKCSLGLPQTCCNFPAPAPKCQE